MDDLVIEEEPEIEEVAPTCDKPFRPGDTINDKYLIQREMGEGGFGAVLEVLDLKSKEILAMKIETHEPKPDEPGLHLEGSALRRLQGYSHILKYYDEDEFEDVNYLVMQMAGSNLADLRKQLPDRRFSKSSTVRVALQCLEAVENVHVAGLLHRDVKPSNFTLGHGDAYSHIVYILDFGMVRKYRLKDRTIRPPRRAAGFRGSIRYASPNAHKNIDLGRHDDLWSLLYTIIELCLGRLPWCNQLSKKVVGETKSKMTKDDLLDEMQPEYGLIFDDLKRLDYNSAPPYAKYRELLMKIVKRKQYDIQAPFDWERSNDTNRVPSIKSSRSSRANVLK